MTLPAAPAAGDGADHHRRARQGLRAARDAIVDVRVTSPDGHVDTVRGEAVPSQPGRFRASTRACESGIYRIAVDARQGQTLLGSTGATMLVGGVDPEMTDPRLNEDTLQRVARGSGGRRHRRRLTSRRCSSASRRGAPAAALAVRHDLWNTGWSFALLAGLLAAEWLTRRDWGLR